MAPAGYVMLERLPVTENGKVDRKALAEVAAGTATREAAGEYAAPRTPIEEMLAQIWADVLRVDRVGINDNFFALGGDSMRILQVLSRAQERGLKLSAQQIYQHQSIHLLALQMEMTLGLSETIADLNVTVEYDQELAAILAELDEASDDEVRSRLRERL
jgi:aryl carrier-like protein